MYDFENQHKEDLKNQVKRKCSMCGEYKTVNNFKIKEEYYRKRYNPYCNNCQRLYMKEYMRVYRERNKKV